jgi:DNA polymerase-1
MQVRRSQLRQVISELSKPGEYGLDTETSGVRWKDRLFSIIIANHTESFYFNYLRYHDVEEDLILDPATIKDLQTIFDNVDSTFYISNAKFDLSMLRKEGLDVHGTVFCTNALGRVLRNNYADGYSLETSAARLGWKKDDAVEEYIKKHKLWTKESVPGKKLEWKNKQFDKVPYPVMSKYAEMDARLHHDLGRYIRQELKRPSVHGAPSLDQVTENEIELTRVCFEMEWTGIKINPDYTRGALEYENGLLFLAKKDFQKETGVEFIDSNKLLADVFTKLGEKYPVTEKGNPSFTDYVLEDLGTPLAQAIQRIRYHEKRAGTYYSSFLYFKDDLDVIHPNMRQGGTETGRFSYSDPNLQNVPKEDEEEDKDKAYVVRGCFVPREDYVFVMIDYQQQEFRLMLDYAGEKKLIEEIMNGADVHQATADLLGIPRKHAKTINFGLLYGMGTEKLARALDLSVNDARSLKDLYFAKLPRVENFIAQVSGRGKARGFIWNWAGRRCYISNREWAYILPNHLIQGGGADVIKFAMPKIARYLANKQSRMLLQVHDELLFEVHKSELDIVPHLKSVMEDIYTPRNGMFLKCSVDHSWKSWGNPDKEKGMPE